MKIKDRVIDFRRVKASELAPHPQNWRTHNDAQRDALKGVLAEIGFAGAALARELPDGTLQLIDGHLRAETVPDQEIPVLVLDLDEAEAAKLLATYDPIGSMAGADAAKLDALLRDFETGSGAVASLLTELAEKHGVIPPQADEPGGGGDEFDATAQDSGGPTRCQAGDLWVVGGVHRVLCGDSTNPEHVARLLGGEVPFLMVTDPPYGVDYDPAWRVESFGPDAERRLGTVANDTSADWSAAWRLFPGDVAYVWRASLHIAEVQRSLIEQGFLPRSLVIWAKPNHQISRGHYHWQHEPCWYAVRNRATARWAGDCSQTTLWQIPLKDDTFNSDHGTQKPLECMARPIRNHGEPGDIVYDPFLGSGTTLVAAHRAGRRCYGMELEPRYCDVVLARAEAEGLSVEKAT